MINRELTGKLTQLLALYPIVSLTGPRQSGKTTLVKYVFKSLPYVSLENPDDRSLALNDPKKFLANYPDGAIFDEVQRVPELFSYLQGIVDNNQDAKFVLSGSQNFLLSEQIGQTLAGRVGILKLLPLSMLELDKAKLLSGTFEEVAFHGFYPRMFDKKIKSEDFYPYYLQTYVERDVRQLSQIGDLHTFEIFLKLCAGRVGQLLNLSGLSNDCGISVNTVKSWLNILETSYITFRLYPHYKNFNKRLVKMPKLYFYDTGLLSYLLGIKHASQVQLHFAKGAIFENLVIAEFIKQTYHAGRESAIYFWRSHKGKEIDLIIENAGKLTPVEIKSGVTRSVNYFENLMYWNKLSKNDPQKSYVVYAGDSDQLTKEGNLISWMSFIHQLHQM